MNCLNIQEKDTNNSINNNGNMTNLVKLIKMTIVLKKLTPLLALPKQILITEVVEINMFFNKHI